MCHRHVSLPIPSVLIYHDRIYDTRRRVAGWYPRGSIDVFVLYGSIYHHWKLRSRVPLASVSLQSGWTLAGAVLTGVHAPNAQYRTPTQLGLVASASAV